MKPKLPTTPRVHDRRPLVGFVEVRIRGVPSVATQSLADGHDAPPQLRSAAIPLCWTGIGRENEIVEAALAVVAPSTSPATSTATATHLPIRLPILPIRAPASAGRKLGPASS